MSNHIVKKKHFLGGVGKMAFKNVVQCVNPSNYCET